MKKLFSLLTLALLTMSAVAGNYVKVTSTSDLTSGKYLIVYEDGKDGNVAFNGALSSLDVASNTVAVTIDNGVIAPKDAIIAAQFDIDVTAGTIKSASGYYIGQTSDANGMKTSQTEAYTNTITITDGNADIKSGGAYLRYNASSGQERFRYFKSTTYTNQKAIQLYKWDGEEDPVMGLLPPVFNPNGGEFSVASLAVTVSCPTENASIYLFQVLTDEDGNEYEQYVNQFFPDNNGNVSGEFYVTESGKYGAYSHKGDDMSDNVYATFTKVTPQCAKPKFTPATGTTFMQGEELDVTISCATEGATITYTVNDDIYEGTAPVVVTLTESATITAVASAEGYTDSDEASATYTMVVPTTTGPVFALVSDINDLKAGDKIILVNSAENGTAVAMGPINSNGRNFLGKNVIVNNGQVQTEEASIITLEQNGDYWNLKTSDKYIFAPGSSNYMQLEDAVDGDGNANAAITVNADTTTIVFQGNGERKIVRYNPNNGSPIFSCYAPTSSVTGAIYIYKTTEEIIEVAAPTFDPASKEFEESIDVTINCATEGATLHYVVGDGDEQTAPAPVTVTLTETTTITAYAELNGVESDIVEATYTLKEADEAITTLAQVNALADNTDFTFAGDAVVTYQYGQYLFLRDNSGYGLIYGTINSNDSTNLNPTFDAGVVLNQNWTAKKTTFRSLIEYTGAQNVSASGNTNAELAAPQAITALSEDMVNALVTISNVVSISGTTATLADGTTITLYNRFNATIPSFTDGNNTITGIVSIYNGALQLYFISCDYEAPQPQVVNVNNIAEALDLDENTTFTMYNDVVVTYQNGNRLWIRDTENNSGLIFGSVEGTFANGQVLSDGWTATYKLYNSVPEFTNPEGIEAAGTETRDAAPFERTTITNDNVNEYVILKGQTLTQDESETRRYYNADSTVLFNTFGLELPDIEEGKTYDVTGLVTIYNGNAQIYITEMTEAAAAGLRGDVNNDTFVNISDVTALIDYLLNPATEINEANADCNIDNAINISDVTALIDFLLSGKW